ncbi:hypothetical protein M271_29080 [Streptomyces rapamycinicus NRRL 5491]|uniref:Uncharacterized protein n=2 Tax=Streptomyces rapamycinicus TaxID=1226757 RepID=A0A0A0NCS2_STRRN|nr:hypothetical protein M271_29080 [Streptomyces rapamycinicus NRRL 5491]MBB4784910.1 hypothetical protein [Streptomyces rapamycinicus]RLV79613.1 hypothetical protein D3C57_114550 [Streptomyces rapamycinicus NRRL 5491]
MNARRPLLTAAAAGSLLCALWFVPSANATVEDPGSSSASSRTSEGSPGAGSGSGPRTEAVPDGDLADTGSVDVTPYLFGGTAFLGLGVAMVTASVRRTRPEAY